MVPRLRVWAECTGEILVVATGTVSSSDASKSQWTLLPGLGAMAEVETIVAKVQDVLFQRGGSQQS